MSKITTIPAGYRLTVTTWENDADNYATVVQEGLEHADVALKVGLLKLFKSKNNGKGHGNLYEPSSREIDACAEAVYKTACKHPGEIARLSKNWVDDWDSEGGSAGIWNCLSQDVLYELQVTGAGEFYTRVVDTVKVEFLPNPIELHDVTSEF